MPTINRSREREVLRQRVADTEDTLLLERAKRLFPGNLERQKQYLDDALRQRVFDEHHRPQAVDQNPVRGIGIVRGAMNAVQPEGD